jgi:excisionase family DNA binding protein
MRRKFDMTINEAKVATFLAPSAAGRQLGVSRDWVRTLIKTGKLRALWTSRGWLIDPADVETLRAAREKA